MLLNLIQPRKQCVFTFVFFSLKFGLFLFFEATEFLYVNIDRQIHANVRIMLNKECNKRDFFEHAAN